MDHDRQAVDQPVIGQERQRTWRAERPVFSEIRLYFGEARMATIHYIDADTSVGTGWRLYPHVSGKRPSRRLWPTPEEAAASIFGAKARTAIAKAKGR